MTEKEALQSAADEARKAARAGREFAALLDDYAKYLTQPSWRQRANESYRSALNKLTVMNAGLATCEKLIQDSAKAAAAEPVQQETTQEPAVKAKAEPAPKKGNIEKPVRRQIRIAKRAAGK